MELFGFQPEDLPRGSVATTMNTRVRTGVAEEAVPFGSAVVQGAGESIRPIADVSDKILGIAIRSLAIETGGQDDPVGYKVGDEVSYLVLGDVSVECETPIARSDLVYVRCTANGAETRVAYGFRTDADTATAAPITYGTVVKGAAANARAVIHFNFE